MTASLLATDDFEEMLPAGAPRDMWLRERRNGIGGSDAPGIAGMDPYSSRLKVYLDKTSALPEQEYTSAMSFGHRAEPMIREWFTELTGVRTSMHGLLRSRENPWQLYTPDSLTDDGGLLEIKTTSVYMAKDWADGAVTDRSAIQGMHGLKVTGLTHVYIAALVGTELHVRRLERDDVLIDDLTAIEDEFWHGHVLAQVPPEFGRHAADPALIKRMHPVADPNEAVVLDDDARADLEEYRSIGAQIKALKAQQDAAQARVCAALGAAESGLIDDKPAVTWRNTGPVNTDRLRAEKPGLYDAYLRTVPEFDKDRFAADHPELYASYRSRRFNPSTPK